MGCFALLLLPGLETKQEDQADCQDGHRDTIFEKNADSKKQTVNAGDRIDRTYRHR